MWAAILKNTASFSTCKLSELSAPESPGPRHTFPGRTTEQHGASLVRGLLAKNPYFTNENPVFVGDAVNFDVVEDVRLGNVAVIPKGSHALGKITTVVPKRRMGRAGKLDMSVEYVRLASGERLKLSGAPERSGNGHQGRMAGAMVATGIIIWPAAPFFLFMHIPAGQEVTVYTGDDYDLPKARAGDTSPVAPAAAPATTSPAVPAPSSTAPVPAPAPATQQK